MLSASIIISGLIQLGVPLLLAFFLVRRYKTEWRLVGIGVLVYLAYQAIELPVLQALAGTDFYASQVTSLPQFTVVLLMGGLSAAMEQGLSLGGFWFVRKSIAEWKDGLGVTSGHAGAGSLVIGLLQLVNFVFVVSTSSSNVQSLSGISAQDALDLQKYLDFYWGQPWHLPLVGTLQSLTLIMLQIALGIMVWLAITRSAWLWIGAAVLWQTAVNGVTLAVSTQSSVLFNVAVYVVIFLLNTGIFYFLYRKIHPDPLSVVGGLA